MKLTTTLKNILTITWFALLYSTVVAQESEKKDLNSQWALTVGVNTIDNNQSGNVFPFDGGFSNFSTPFYTAVERSISKKASLVLNFASNKLKNKNNVSKHFWNTSLSFNYNIDALLFKKDTPLDVILGSGFGFYHTDNNENMLMLYRLNLTYWVTQGIGVTAQHQANLGYPKNNDDVNNFHQLIFGVKFRL